MQAAFEQKQVAGIVTGVKPAAPSRALLNAFDLDIPFAMNVMAITRFSAKESGYCASGRSELISKPLRR